jgi:hypothetical protein
MLSVAKMVFSSTALESADGLLIRHVRTSDHILEECHVDNRARPRENLYES